MADLVRESVPAIGLVAIGLPLFHAERRVEQEHALLRPRRQISMRAAHLIAMQGARVRHSNTVGQLAFTSET